MKHSTIPCYVRVSVNCIRSDVYVHVLKAVFIYVLIHLIQTKSITIYIFMVFV